MSAYGWVIDQDFIVGAGGGCRCEVGTIGPRNASDSVVQALNEGRGAMFRLLDGDRNLYYQGRICDPLGDATMFEPLCDFGMPNAGCTIIQYLAAGLWEDL